MTAGSDLVFDHLSHNHTEPRVEYQFFFNVLLVHSDLSLDERLFFCLPLPTDLRFQKYTEKHTDRSRWRSGYVIG